MQQGKGIIMFFLVAMTLVTLVQYFFIVPTQGVERDADEYAQAVSATIEDEKERKIVTRKR